MSDRNHHDADHLETLDRDLHRLAYLEGATQYVARPMVGPGIALAFVVVAGFAAAIFFGQEPSSYVVVLAAVFGAYMALNIGANDVANNMGPAVGANALTLGGAIAIAAIFESAGALLAGGDVVSTISKGIIAPSAMASADVFIWAMMAALISAALWVNLATWVSAPVSTTHSVVGGVMGAGIAAAGFSAVSWPTMGAIAASWVISPLLGGVIAAAFLALIKSRVIYRDDKIKAAKKWVPILVGIMAGAFAAYLALKGLKRVMKIDLPHRADNRRSLGHCRVAGHRPADPQTGRGAGKPQQVAQGAVRYSACAFSGPPQLCPRRKRRSQRCRPSRSHRARGRVRQLLGPGGHPHMGHGHRRVRDQLRALSFRP